MKFTRRAAFQGIGAFAAISAISGVGSLASEADIHSDALGVDLLIHVNKDANCGCCSAWIDTLVAAGFTVTSQDVEPEDMSRIKSENGIPSELASCHTAIIAGYVIEGHVPPSDIIEFLEISPNASGLAVPGMPWGSPGMGPESEREAYDVLVVEKDGTSTVFKSYEAA
jgi:hypothetical protein